MDIAVPPPEDTTGGALITSAPPAPPPAAPPVAAALASIKVSDVLKAATAILDDGTFGNSPTN